MHEKNEPVLYRGVLSDRWFLTTNYLPGDNGVALVNEKIDVTDTFHAATSDVRIALCDAYEFLAGMGRDGEGGWVPELHDRLCERLMSLLVEMGEMEPDAAPAAAVLSDREGKPNE
jgi:hypothetical protein